MRALRIYFNSLCMYVLLSFPYKSMVSSSTKYKSNHVDFGRVCTEFGGLSRPSDFTNTCPPT